mgnify:CR=1 FL=1
MQQIKMFFLKFFFKKNAEKFYLWLDPAQFWKLKLTYFFFRFNFERQEFQKSKHFA